MPLLHPAMSVSGLARQKHLSFEIAPDSSARAQLADYLGLTALRKFRFAGELRPLGAHDWTLKAELGATVVQPCGVTTEPVTTRIDEPVLRNFIKDYVQPDALEVEMPEDDTQEPLGQLIDLSAIAIEALTLALPAYPRAAGAGLTDSGSLQAAPSGQNPISDDDVKPFAGLAKLRDALSTQKSDDE